MAVQRSLEAGSATAAAAFLPVPVELVAIVTDLVAVLNVTTVVVELTEPVPELDPEPEPLPDPVPVAEPDWPGVMVVQLTIVVHDT